MSFKAGTIALCILVACAAGAVAGWAFDYLPMLSKPDEYGTLLLDRRASKHGQKPVLFSHWRHRVKFTCRVCHTELGISMQLNATSVGSDSHRPGRFCGACHNGTLSFGHQDNCTKCHTGSIAEDSAALVLFRDGAPVRNSFGDGVNWVELLRRGTIKPLTTLQTEPKTFQPQKTITMETQGGVIPPVFFPHRAHTDWLDCSSCHPELFPQGESREESARKYLFRPCRRCGSCHVRVAFPFNDCQRCHPGMRESMK